MKTMFATLALVCIGSMGFSQSTEKATLKVATNESSIEWTGKKVTGSHTGNIDISEGTIRVNNGVIESALVTIDMTTILVTDEGMSDDMKGKLTGHLNSPDFFNVEEHDKAMFQLTSFAPAKDKSKGNYLITGKLTIKGITNEISFPANVTLEKGMVRAEAVLEFDRTKWNVRYGSGSFFDGLGDSMIYDDIKIAFTLVAKA